MISKICANLFLIVSFIVISFSYLNSQDKSAELFNKEYDLIKNKEAKNHIYSLETFVVTYDLDGKISNRELYSLTINVNPLNENQCEYICKDFKIILSDSTKIKVPGIIGYSYTYDKTKTNPDDKGQLFGLNHSSFENLKDERGNSFDPAKTYFIYNSFIDFHSLIDVFAADMKNENGIEDLNKIGDNIIHRTAFSEPPVNLGSSVKDGSTFKNGKVTLNFTGLSYINENTCAIIHYDSGECSFKMIMEPMPDFSITSKGSSHYFGDIFINLKTKWIEKADLKEFVVSEVDMPSMKTKINNVIERELSLQIIE